MRFCDRLKKCRTDRNLTQAQLADILNVKQSTVGNWESGAREPDFEMLKVLADLFGVTSDYLIAKEDTEKDIASLTDEQWERDMIQDAKKLSPERRNEVKNFLAYQVQQESQPK